MNRLLSYDELLQELRLIRPETKRPGYCDYCNKMVCLCMHERRLVKERSMALKALTRRRVGPDPKTLSELLAKVFTASNYSCYKGTFREEAFEADYTGIEYRGDEINDPSPGENTGFLRFENPFNLLESNFCCGLGEVGNFANNVLSPDPAVTSALMRVFMASVHDDYNMVFGTVVPNQKGARANLEAGGFTPVADFKSKSTGAQITVFMHEAVKELPSGNFDLSNLDFKEYSNN